MFQIDPLGLIPQSIKDAVLNTTVDFLSSQAKKLLGDEVAAKIKKLNTDAAFHQSFEKGLKRALERFKQEYEEQDEDIVATITSDSRIFKDEKFQATLLAMIKRPGGYLEEERAKVIASFASILPGRKNRQRVDQAIAYLLRCIVEEVWHLPELQPIYSLQFQRMTAEAMREQVELQKLNYQALTQLDAGIREALTQLSGALLEHTKALGPGSAPTIQSEPLVKHNLPNPGYTCFVGREKELTRLANLLRPYPHSQHSLMIIDGVGGIGKSTLALEVALRYLRNAEKIPSEERFDAIVWISAKKEILVSHGIQPRPDPVNSLDDIYRTIGLVLEYEGIARSPIEAQPEMVRLALTKYRTLLVIDNFETIDDERTIAFLRELPAPTKAIVTTRHRIDVAYTIRLVGMSWAEAQNLIKQECQNNQVDLSETDFRHLYDRSGGIPLAMIWSIAQISRGYPAEKVLRNLSKPVSDLVEYCFKSQFDLIRNTPCYRLMLAAALFSPTGSREAIGVIADLEELDRDDGLVELEGLSLINRAEGRFSLLSLVQSYLLEEFSKDEVISRQFIVRFIKYYQAFSEQNGGDHWYSYPNLDLEIDNIQAAISYARSGNYWEEVVNIIFRISRYLDRRGRWKELIAYSEIGLQTAYILADQKSVASYKSFGLGWVKGIHFKQYDEGIRSAQEALVIARPLGDHRLTAIVLWDLADMIRYVDRIDEARTYAQESLTLFQRIDDYAWELRTLSMLGAIEALVGNLEKAKTIFEEALEKSRKLKYPENIALSTRRLARVLMRLGRLDEAHLLALESVEIYSQLDAGIAHAYACLSEIESKLGMLAEAEYHAQLVKTLNEKFISSGSRKAEDQRIVW
jgi:LuxR family glucitol operon transcriptional activator